MPKTKTTKKSKRGIAGETNIIGGGKQKFDKIVRHQSPEKTKAYLATDHVWKKKNGFIDIFGNGNDRHNGPLCIKCGYGLCWHCTPKPNKKCGHRR